MCECLDCIINSDDNSTIIKYFIDIYTNCTCGVCELPFSMIEFNKLMIFVDTILEDTMLTYYASMIHGGSIAAAKHAPREGHSFDRKYNLVSKISKKLGISKCQYRKLIANLS